MMQRNWSEICKLYDPYLRLAISLARSEEILAGFAKGFPHLFLEGTDPGPLKVPLSVLMEAALQESKKAYEKPLWEVDQHFSLILAFEMNPHLRIPEAFRWEDDEIPSEVTSQFVGRKAKAGIVVDYRDQQYIVLDLEFNEPPPEIGSVFERRPRMTWLVLGLAEFVDLDA